MSTGCPKKRKPKQYKTYRWNEQTDEALKMIAVKYKRDWKKISKFFEINYFKITPHALKNRFKLLSGDKCLLRINFTNDEDLKILDLHRRHRTDWDLIATHFENRTALMIKNRFYSHLRKHGRNDDQDPSLNNSSSTESSQIDSNELKFDCESPLIITNLSKIRSFAEFGADSNFFIDDLTDELNFKITPISI
jgi:hypothetical protein